MALVTAQVALLAGVSSFPQPPNWDPTSNKVEVVSPGGQGSGGTGTSGNRGGPGGQYAWDANLTIPAQGFVAINILATGQVWWGGSAQTPGNVTANNTNILYPRGSASGTSGVVYSSGSGGSGGGGPGGPNGIGAASADVFSVGDPGSPGGIGNGGLAPPGQRENPPSWPLVNIGLGGGGKGGDPGGAPSTNGVHAGGGGGGGGPNQPSTLNGGGVIIISWEAEQTVALAGGMGQVIG